MPPPRRALRCRLFGGFAAYDGDVTLYPINLDVEGKLCLVVGGGRVALGKVKELLRCGAEVKAVAPSICDELSELAEQPPAPLQLLRRHYAASDLDGCLVAIAATGDSAVNRQVFQDGHRQGVLVNSADDPQNCHFTLPARLRRGDLLITISTAGRSPAMASWLRQRIEASLDHNTDQMLQLAAEVREEIQAQGIPTEPLDWTTALNNGILDLIQKGNPAEAKARLRTSLGIPSRA